MGKPADQSGAVIGLEFKKLRAVDDAGYYFPNIKGLA